MPESQHTEYKRQWKDDLLKWLCAFANAEGGTLVVGYNDQGQAADVKPAQSCRKALLSHPQRFAQSRRSGALAAIARMRSPSHAPQPQPKSARGLASYGELYRQEGIKDACTQGRYPTPTWALEPGGWRVTFGYTPEDASAVLQGVMGRQELMQRLGLRDEKHFRQHYQQAAIALGVIEMTLPETPRSRLQKYRLTEAGQQRQAALLPASATTNKTRKSSSTK